MNESNQVSLGASCSSIFTSTNIGQIDRRLQPPSHALPGVGPVFLSRQTHDSQPQRLSRALLQRRNQLMFVGGYLLFRGPDMERPSCSHDSMFVPSVIYPLCFRSRENYCVLLFAWLRVCMREAQLFVDILDLLAPILHTRTRVLGGRLISR